jgi:uncharacterized membrane protein
MFQKMFMTFAVFSFLFFLFTSQSFAQVPTQAATLYVKGTVSTILQEKTISTGQMQSPSQKVSVQILEGTDKGKNITIDYGSSFAITPAQKVQVGTTVILSRTVVQGKTMYQIVDKYRLTPLLLILVFFFLFVIALSGKKGVGAVLGLFVSLAVLVLFIVPQILGGNDPLFISIIGSIGIMITTIYLAHGISQQTTVAVGSTAISLVITGVIGWFFISVIHLAGLGSEDIFTLQQSFGNAINYQGLLLGGIIIGALGALDDVTTTQAATIYTLAKADPKASMQTLISHGFTIGKEHIASLVNTLVLAYAGASIGIFFFLVISQQNHIQPLWVILNSETLVEEIVRTIAGSIGLILAVPLTTVIAAFFAKYDLKIH